MHKSFAIALAALLSAVPGFTQVVLPKILSDHMVIQRELPIHVWGMAKPGETITVTFHGESGAAQANDLGRWGLYLRPATAGGPYQMTVAGNLPEERAIVINDILVGDVWVASGQSNMEFEMYKASTAAEDLPMASDENLRLIVIKRIAANFPQDDIQGNGWASSTPETAKNFSAAAWYFAHEIEAREHVPVGVIDSTWGGTPVEAWTRMAALGTDAGLNGLFLAWSQIQEQQADIILRKALGDHSANTSHIESWGPAGLYNGMIAPLTQFPIKGALWYQGESNGDFQRAPLYGHIFRTMIEDWRRQWSVGNFPFLFVQLASYKNSSDWPTLRDEQLKTLQLTNTAMAVAIDIGNPTDVHPTDKKTLGLRLALAGRALGYGEQIEFSGPIFRLATPEQGAIRAWFDHASGLTAKGGVLTGFEVAGADGKFVAATAKIENGTVVASSSDVKQPVLIRYGWDNNPACNLYNSEGLPASPFNSGRR